MAKVFRFPAFSRLLTSASFLFLLALLVVAAPFQAAEARQTEPPMLRQTQAGPVLGLVGANGKTLAWLGVPYAEPPVGPLRWKAPRQPQHREGVFEATAYGNMGIQKAGGQLQGSEDCLNLNIFRPNTQAVGLPVFLFLHGGNNQVGSNRDFNGAYLAERGDCVVVSMNYRLGLLGFNRLPALKSANPVEDSGNYALLDCAAALDWLAANIAAFGGDPGNITVSGLSSGGRDVMAMLISPLFRGKFHKAVVFSGGMTVADPKLSEQVFARALVPYVLADGIRADESGALQWLLSIGEDVWEYLRAMPAERLASAVGPAAIRMSVFPQLFADGTVLPREGFDTHEYNAVPLMMLTSSKEFSTFANRDPRFAEGVRSGSLLTDKEALAEYEFASKYGSLLYGLFNVQESAERMLPFYPAPIFTCEVKWGDNPAAVGEKMALFYGAFHGVMVDFLMGEGGGQWSPVSKTFPEAYKTPGAMEMSAVFMGYLKNFLRTGDPNSGLLQGGSQSASQGASQGVSQGVSQTAGPKGGPEPVRWEAWKSAANPATLVLDADKNKAFVRMSRERIDYTQVLQKMERDESISAEARAAIISQVLNGRWFSRKLDEHFQNPSLWPR